MTADDRPILLYVTAADRKEALRVGRALVEEGLAACVNVLDGMTSVYRWKDAVEQADEAVLLVKTLAARFDAVAARIKQLHSYETPCVLEIPLGRGDPDYAAWLIAGSCAAPPAG
jgi:periplasmic divalent cation tolerance protein